MFLKKSLLIGTALTLALSSVAKADLHTYNYTRQDSTVRITSNGNICAAQIPPYYKYTPASPNGATPGESHANHVEINVLCKKDPCTAQIFMNRDCSGAPVATAVLTGVGTAVHNVKITSITDGRYAITANGGVVTLRGG